MNQDWTCPLGHRWHLSVDETGELDHQRVVCPVCGARPIADARGGTPRNDREATNAYSPGGDQTLDGGFIPTKLGKFEITHKLGRGGFGVVYQGIDPDLGRAVAIKVPHRHLFASREDAALYLAEARTLALLDHPAIVPIYEVGRLEDGRCYLVSKLVDGMNLAQKLLHQRLPRALAVAIVIRVAEALHHAHQQGIIHRDIKPANILLDARDNALVTDFGVALRDEEYGRGLEFAGTPAYMSPEQARHEGHRVDARSDVYSLGVVFYELLTGRKTFQGDGEALLEQITQREPRPPRQFDDTIPKELDRICLKALSKRAADRYSTALDLADDLRHWQSGEEAVSTLHFDPAPAVVGRPAPDSDQRPLRIVPRGLRSYEGADADFFLDLLPGPRNRDGLPDSIHFWKTRLEATDADQTFPVGLMYGPSGCGKSSLIKAGVLPRLAGHVLTVYVEATSRDTEAALLKGLRKRCPGLPAGLDLATALEQLRRGQGRPGENKVVIILDQFEQWLHAHREETDAELVRALRQCDGEHVQVVILVRDDFWMAATRFLRELEVPLIEGRNAAAVDLFDPRHARKVLAAFGRAFGALPENGLTPEQERFLDRAVNDLVQDGKVISVRLALFADMIKGKPWLPATLQAVGGTEGIGATFLEETFSARTAPLEHRLHQQAARAVLKALLPEAGTDIKGHLRAREELLAKSGYVAQPREFEDLLRILDSELRLITLTEAEGDKETRRQGDKEIAPPVAPGTVREDSVSLSPCLLVSLSGFYQLTHDYLVPSLRTWLSRKQRETWRGRAELRLVERAAAWNAKPEVRQFPAWWEWLTICLGTHRRDWTGHQHKMMRQAARHHAFRGCMLVLVLALVGYGLYEVKGRLQADHLVQMLATAETPAVPRLLEKLTPYRRWTEPRLRQLAADSGPRSKERLHAYLVLMSWNDEQVDYLADQVLLANLDELPVLLNALRPHASLLQERFWSVLEDDRNAGGQRLRAACALAASDPDSPRWDKVSGVVVRTLVTQDALVLSRWAQILAPVRARLAEPLVERTAEADLVRFPALLLLLRLYAGVAIPQLEQALEKTSPATALEADRDALAKQQARLAAALLLLGAGDKVWPLLQHHGPDPRRRTYLLHWLAPLGVEPELLLQRLKQESDVTARRALLLSLGEYTDDKWAANQRRDLTARLLRVYRDDGDAGIHAAVDWLLRRWGQGQELRHIERELVPKQARGERQWYVNSQAQTLAVIFGPVEFPMGSPPGRYPIANDETLHPRRIPRSFAIGTKKVTLAQFRKLHKDHPQQRHSGPDDETPVNGVSWYEAAEYCNWLSQQEGMPKTEWCYEPTGEGKFEEGMKLAPDYLHRQGYRLPTEAEWEYACRAGALTAYGFGEAEDLLGYYGWYGANSGFQSHPVGLKKPNDRGLFDTHGNLWEWTLDRYQEYPKGPGDDREGELEIPDKTGRTLRGGAFNSVAWDLRSANRFKLFPSLRYSYAGLRVARTYP